jgi:hypothetical protein
MQVGCAGVRILLLGNLIFIYGWSPVMGPFEDRYAELRDSIALKAGATTSEAEAYLNLGRMPITREAELRFQNSLTNFSPEERRFVRENHIIASSLNNLQVPLAPVILQVPKEASPSDTNPESSPVTKSKAIKPTPGKSRSRRVVGKTIDSDLVFITALNKHHRYGNGSCGNIEPIGCGELAEKTKLAKSTASRFFKKEFQGYKNYQLVCKTGRISQSLKLLNKDVAPHILLGKKAAEIAGQPAPDKDL